MNLLKNSFLFKFNCVTNYDYNANLFCCNKDVNNKSVDTKFTTKYSSKSSSISDSSQSVDSILPLEKSKSK